LDWAYFFSFLLQTQTNLQTIFLSTDKLAVSCAVYKQETASVMLVITTLSIADLIDLNFYQSQKTLSAKHF